MTYVSCMCVVVIIIIVISKLAFQQIVVDHQNRAPTKLVRKFVFYVSTKCPTEFLMRSQIFEYAHQLTLNLNDNFAIAKRNL